MDTLITVAIVALAALWFASRLFRRRTKTASGGCSSGCDGCAFARRGPSGAPGCGVVPAGAAARPAAAPALPLPSRDRENQ